MKILTAIFILALAGSSASAHPGRLDINGCHTVGEGQRKPGEPKYHCHRQLGKMRIGEDVLDESKTKPTKAKTKQAPTKKQKGESN